MKIISAYKNFKVSVVIPVYNAEKYLRNAVLSAISLIEVGEVILIEDKSPDNSLELCKQLEKIHSKVKLYQHPRQENKGAGASRNLGIKMAKFEFISFLDADDWYLDNRFKHDTQIFKDQSVDGVYNAVGYYIDGKGKIEGKLTTVRKSLDPSDLLYYILIGHYGHFHTNGITIRKNLLKKTGYFSDLRLHQDSHLWYRLAHFGKIVAGNIEEPVSMRRVHQNNRIVNRNKKSQFLLMQAVYNDFIKYEKVDKRAMRIILKKWMYAKSRNEVSKYMNYFKWIISNPEKIKKIL